MTKIKICGITNFNDLELVSSSGADAIGVIVDIPRSPRNIPREKARKLVRKTPIFTKTVIVIAPDNLEEAVSLCEYIEPDVVQIHSDKVNIKDLSESTNRIKIIQTLNANKVDDPEYPSGLEYSDALLLDSLTSGHLGGTGKVHDWRKSKKMVELINPKPLILAGGLNPDNVKKAIEFVKPYAVDVCTGTESRPGIKDPDKVQQFLSNVREADRRNIIE